MKKNFLKVASAILASCITLCGCGGNGGNQDTKIDVTTDGKYPMNTDVTLRYWTTFNNNLVSNRGELEFSKFLEEATGVKVTYEHPAVGSEKEGFNIMMASEELPDIIQSNWSLGLADQYIEDGFLLDLTPYYEAGLMPNLKKIFDKHPEYKKMATTASGKLFYFPQILEDDILSSYYSYYINKDLLDKAGLDIPETIDEWETCLYKFKEMGVKVPVTLNLSYPYLFMSPFMSPFDEMGTFYHDEKGKIHFGPGEEQFGEWIKRMAKWYQDGILDSEFVDQSGSRIAAMVTNGEVGAYYGLIGGQYGAYLDAMSPPGKYNYVPTKVPVKNKGDRAMANQSDPMVKADGAAIGATCKNPEIAVRFLDYGYSEEGQLTWNFGKEGVSYNMVDGKPVYSDILTDASKRDGKTFAQMLSLYTAASLPVSVQKKAYIEQYYQKPQQIEALKCASDTDVKKYMLPSGMFTQDQQKQISDLFTPIKTYADETISKLIAGKLPISDVDKYLSTIKSMNIDNVIEIYQDAYDKFESKK